MVVALAPAGMVGLNAVTATGAGPGFDVQGCQTFGLQVDLTGSPSAAISQVPVIDANLNGDDPVVYILRMASKRRHLTDDQRAMLADEEREWLADKSKRERASKGGKTGGRNHPKSQLAEHSVPQADEAKPEQAAQQSPVPSKESKARKDAAKAHNVSPRKVQQAQAVKNASPELAEKVKNGEVPLAQAARQVANESAVWFTLLAWEVTTPQASGDVLFVTNKPVRRVRCCLEALSGGTVPTVTAKMSAA